jgi:hypothetical protein
MAPRPLMAGPLTTRAHSSRSHPDGRSVLVRSIWRIRTDSLAGGRPATAVDGVGSVADTVATAAQHTPRLA